jgi:hypothetical protein
MQKGEAFVKNGKTLLSGIEPVRRAERTADAVSLKDKTLYICPSPIYGYGLDRLLSRLETEAPNSAILCMEADSELYELTQKAKIAESHKLRITNITDAAALCAFVRETWGARAFRRLDIVRFTGGWQLFPETYDSLCDALNREIATTWSNALTLTKLGRLYMRNALRNLPLLGQFPSVENLSFGNSPVLVLGAGPSLDETLDALGSCPENRGFKIVCVDTCLGALKDRGIVPDLVVILESQHWNLRDFVGAKGWEAPFVIDLSALPESAQMLSGKGYFFMTPWTDLNIFKRLKKERLLPAVIPPLGSVGITAVEVARRLTGGKITCAGLDFSFTVDKYHARGTPGHRRALNTHNRFGGLFNLAAFDEQAFNAVNAQGKTVRSNPAMRHYRELFEREFGGDTRVCTVKPGSVKGEFHAENAENAEGREGKVFAGTKSVEIREFLMGERLKLKELRGILTGDLPGQERLGELIEECDYLWAHFPDRVEGNMSSSFLNRVRMEIEPALALLERS